MQDLRIILIILGAVAIAALLIHGLWASQKGRQKPIREKPIEKFANKKADSTETDTDGFDRDGIGQVRVAGSGHQAASLVDETEIADDWHDTPHFSAINDDDDEPSLGLPPRLSSSAFSASEEPHADIEMRQSPAEQRVAPKASQRDAKTDAKSETQAEQRMRRYQEGEIDPLFDEPHHDHSDTDLANTSLDGSRERIAPELSEPELNEQSAPELELSSKNSEPEPALVPDTPEPVRPLREVPKTWQDVYVINLVAQPNQQLKGHDLIRALTQADFSFGEMDIFHRHQGANAQGEPLFSLINMVKPGTFNPNAMAEFSSPGVSIFMQLPKPGMAKNQFNLMVQAAENMSEALDGLLLDAERRPLSPDYLAHCREQLRDFDSQAQ